jgi:hypothetical protein
MQTHNHQSIDANTPMKAGWRVREWCGAVGVGRSHLYELLNQKKVRAVKSGKATIIVTPPQEYLASLPAA